MRECRSESGGEKTATRQCGDPDGWVQDGSIGIVSMVLAGPDAREQQSLQIRVRGRVQGVGFRPAVWRLANEYGLDGEVLNDSEGVLIRTRGPADRIESLIARLSRDAPPLSRVEAIEKESFSGDIKAGFRIVESASGKARTEIAPDAVICAACATEILSPTSRRFRYPFTNCTHCGPRLTIVRGVPYDRSVTAMAPFPMCRQCADEYENPADRRFHAEPIACVACGPRARLVRLNKDAPLLDQSGERDAIKATFELIRHGEIVAVKALGGYQLACDATQADAIARLRQLKRRDRKPFALMARDIDVIRRYCRVSPAEERALCSPVAPIVLLDANGPQSLPDGIAPGMALLGFMLPSTPLHVLLLGESDFPMVMTSGNLSDEPQVIDDIEAATKLASIARYALTHDRDIVNRVDDSVVRLAAGKIRVLRRARGFAPASSRLPQGFEKTPDILAFGPQMKATFCVVKDGRAVLSQHQGDLEEAATSDDYRRNLGLFAMLFDHEPVLLACDKHPQYRSTYQAREQAAKIGVPLVEVQHHHAHVAACIAENGRPLHAPPVLGVAFDGLGYGMDATVWGGEFLLADYRGFQRLGSLIPVAMPGGAKASREPWRNLYAHLTAVMEREQLITDFGKLEAVARLTKKPLATLDAMVKGNVNSPLSSSCGRLFDAVAAALGLCFERQSYEGEAAMLLEAAACCDTLQQAGKAYAYPFALSSLEDSGLLCIDPRPMWRALLGDLMSRVPIGVIADRFHKGLAAAVARMAARLAHDDDGRGQRFDTVALSGGCFHNRILLEETVRHLEDHGFHVLSHAEVPAGDGGVALGQAVVAAALSKDVESARQEGD